MGLSKLTLILMLIAIVSTFIVVIFFLKEDDDNDTLVVKLDTPILILMILWIASIVSMFNDFYYIELWNH